MPKISVIIPSYNCARFLPEAIESVLRQAYRDYEIIVIDDGSEDDTKEVIRRYLNDFPDKIRYIYQDNKGLAVARNTGIKNAKGEFIALLDADDKLFPERLETCLNAIESDKAIGLVHANITRISEDGTVIDTPNRDQRFLSGYIFKHIFLRRAHISCPTILFRKECCERVGLFDENLARLGCEDRELWLRIACQYRMVYIDKVLAYYRVISSSMSRDKEKMMKARLYVIDKYCPTGKNIFLRRKALGVIYRDLGDEFLLEKNMELAQKNYFKSIFFAPLSIWTWINLIKTVFG